MDSSNYWYAHANILAEYCGFGFDDPPRIDGVIQHGWTFVHGFGYGHQPPNGFAKYIWADVNRGRGQAIGWRDYVVIGAPFLYLDRIMPPEEDVEPEGTIWYPFHGTADFEKLEGDHNKLIDEIKETEDGPVTVCLYYVEYENPAIREHFENSGFRVISHGRRGWMRQGGNPDFLKGQLRELRKHKRVASNRLSTAVFYGASIGLEPAVYGDPMEMTMQAGFNGSELLLGTFPEFHGAHLDVEVCRPIAERELGKDSLMSPEELRIALGWQDEWLLLQEQNATATSTVKDRTA